MGNNSRNINASVLSTYAQENTQRRSDRAMGTRGKAPSTKNTAKRHIFPSEIKLLLQVLRAACTCSMNWAGKGVCMAQIITTLQWPTFKLISWEAYNCVFFPLFFSPLPPHMASKSPRHTAHLSGTWKASSLAPSFGKESLTAPDLSEPQHLTTHVLRSRFFFSFYDFFSHPLCLAEAPCTNQMFWKRATEVPYAVRQRLQ